MIKAIQPVAKLFRLLIAITVVFTMLSGCGPTQVKPDDKQQDISSKDAAKMIEAAQNMSGAEKVETLIHASIVLIHQNEFDWARQTLNSISVYEIQNRQLFAFNLAAAKLALLDGKPLIAKALIWDPKLEPLYPFAPIEQQIDYHMLRAEILFDFNEYDSSIRERLMLSALLPRTSDTYQANDQALWQALMAIPQDELETRATGDYPRRLKGWYALAAVSKNNQANLARQVEALDQWARQWPAHPANGNLPADLRLIQQLALEEPKNIALFLPLTGRLSTPAKAIRDGFMAAYFQNLSFFDVPPVIRIYDTHKQDINQLYQVALSEGAEIIIGPLEKDNITQLADAAELEVPILALNHIDSETNASLPLYQFGLTIEDEARQAAKQAWRDGHRRALVLAPESLWGDRGVTAFIDQWLELGGYITKDYRYKTQNTYSQLIQDAVQVSESQARLKTLRSTLGVNMEFEPRRRQDIDFIFMIANAAAARQLKPTLAFHYASDIPVYGISHVYNGKTNSKQDRDMNGIKFTTLPWYFDKNIQEKTVINANTSAENYQGLYALGVDAFYIYPRLKQLDQVQDSHYYGATGALSIDEKKRIVRMQIWANFKNGKATAMSQN